MACPLCDDTRWKTIEIDGVRRVERCDCWRDGLTARLLDEARIPPPLDGVGAKLNLDYVKQVLDKGAHDRPYMHTKMPGFGSAIVNASAFSGPGSLSHASRRRRP